MIELCFELQVAYEDLSGQGRKGKILQLVELCDRYGRVPDLLALAAKKRPLIQWPEYPIKLVSKVKQREFDFDDDWPLASNNPSMEVASLFGIRVSALPGIVLFTLSEDGKGISSGVFLPLETTLFETHIQQIEDVIADMFDVIQDSRKTTATPLALLDNVRTGIEHLKREQNKRPFITFLHEQVLPLNLPRTQIIERILLQEQNGRLGPQAAVLYG
jgi:hypothetical protein